MPEKPRERVKELLHAHTNLMVTRADMPGDTISEVKLAVLGLGVPNREGIKRLGNHLLGQSSDATGIDSAAEKYTQWNIAHQAHADGFLEALPALVNPVLFRALRGALGQARRIPVLFRANL